MSEHDFEQRMRLGRLFDIYGGLLTEKQQQCLKLYFYDDLSLTEIAEETGVSRQAIHDLLKRVELILEQLQPDYLLMLGMNSGSTDIILDTVAINLRDALIEDNLGKKPWNEPIITDGPAAYFATLDVHTLVKKLRKEKLPVAIGYSSGAYICNEVFYLSLHNYHNTKMKVGFIHVPLIPEMAWDESMARPLEETTAILQKIIEEI